MNLLDKIELFYKMAQQLETGLEDSNSIDETETIEPINDLSTASVKKRMSKLAAITKK